MITSIFKRTLFSLFLFGTVLIYGQIPPGYYDPAQGLTGQALQTALHNIIKGHTVVSYSSLWTYFQTTDKKSNGTVWDMYSDVPGGTPPYVFQFGTDQCGNYSAEGDCYNREHSWPKAWFGGDIEPMYTDIFHLYPTDGYVNGRRSDYPYGEVGSASWTSQNGSKVGNCSWTGYSGTVFEPIDGYKGDLARTYFYMSVRYYSEDSGWPGSAMTTGSQLKPWALSMMLQWNTQDPVSQKEIDRNNAVYSQVQHNRNPFIDHPEYADEIWGSGMGILSKLSGKRLIIYPNPAEDYCYLLVSDTFSKEKLEVKINDLQGKSIDCFANREGDRIRLNLIGLDKGLYFVSLTGLKNGDITNGLILKK